MPSPASKKLQEMLAAIATRVADLELFVDSMGSGIDIPVDLSGIQADISTLVGQISDQSLVLTDVQTRLSEIEMAILAASGIIISPGPPSQDPETTLFNENFSPGSFNWSVGGTLPWPGIKFKNDYGAKPVIGKVKEAEGGTSTLEITLPRIGMPGGQSGRYGLLATPTEGPWDDLKMTHSDATGKILFSTSFDPAKGGRLFGVQSNEYEMDADSNAPNGTSDGAQVLLGWGVSKGGNLVEGKLYIAHQGATGPNGIDTITFSTDLVKGASTILSVEVALNLTAGATNGVVTAYLNGAQVAQKSDCVFYITSEGNRALHQWEGIDIEVKHLGVFHAITLDSANDTAAEWDAKFESRHGVDLDNTWTEDNVIVDIGGNSSGWPRSEDETIAFGGALEAESLLAMHLRFDDIKYLDRMKDMFTHWDTYRDDNRGISLAGSYPGDTNNNGRYWWCPVYHCATDDTLPFPAWVRSSSSIYRMAPKFTSQQIYPFALYLQYVCPAGVPNRNLPQAHRDYAVDNILPWLQEVILGTGAVHSGNADLYTDLATSWLDPGDANYAGWAQPDDDIGNCGLAAPQALNGDAGLVSSCLILDEVLGGDAAYNTIADEVITAWVDGESSDDPGTFWLTHIVSDNSLKWDRTPKKHDIPGSFGQDQIEDLNHARIDIQMLMDAYHHPRGAVGPTTLTDLQRFANTFNVTMKLGAESWSFNVDGTGGSANDQDTAGIATHIIRLSEFDTDLLDSIVACYNGRFDGSNSRYSANGWANLLSWGASSPNTQAASSGPTVTLSQFKLERV